MFWHLVDRRRREDVPGAQGAEKHLAVEDPGEVVNVGIAQVDPYSIGSVLGDDRCQTFPDEGERLLPCGVTPTVVGTDLRCSQPVWIGFELFESGTLGANEPVGEDIVAISANAAYRVVLDRDLQTTGGLTQGQVRYSIRVSAAAVTCPLGRARNLLGVAAPTLQAPLEVPETCSLTCLQLDARTRASLPACFAQ